MCVSAVAVRQDDSVRGQEQDCRGHSAPQIYKVSAVQYSCMDVPSGSMDVALACV